MKYRKMMPADDYFALKGNAITYSIYTVRVSSKTKIFYRVDYLKPFQEMTGIHLVMVVV